MIADPLAAGVPPAYEILPRVERYKTGNAYVVDWIKHVLQKPAFPAFDTSRLNGASNNQAVMDAVDSLETVHKTGGFEAARIAWFATVAETLPGIAEVVNQPKRLFNISELDELKPLRYLFDRQIPEQGLSVLYGPPGCGKSFLALDWSLRLAMRQRPVVYVAAEGQSGFRDRSRAWVKHHVKDTDPSPKSMYFYFDALNLLDEFKVEHFMSEIQFVRPDLLVFDTLALCMGQGDENSTRDMNAFVNSCKRFQRELQCAVMVVHHTNKGGGDARGSTALRGAADSMLEVRDYDDIILLRSSKLKDDAPPPNKKFELLSIPLDDKKTSAVPIPASKINADPDALRPNQARMMEILASPMFEGGTSTSELRQASELANSTFFHVVNGLIKRELVSKISRGNYCITEMGMSLARRKGLV